VDKDNATANQKVLAPALADGTLVGYGDHENLAPPEGGFTHDNWWKAKSGADVMKLIEAFHKAGGSSSLVSSTQHWSERYLSTYYNWKAGSWKGAYEYRFAGAGELKNAALRPAFGVTSSTSRFKVT
jgi:hypothetical protein